MDFIVANWKLILGVVIFIAVAVALIILYRKNKVTVEYLELLNEYLDQIDDGDSIVSLLAGYAKQAVRAVEQMVKAGVIPKTNDARKDMAMRIVGELAAADGIELDESEKSAADSLIESEVFELKSV